MDNTNSLKIYRAVRRACVCCRRRKIRCNGAQPCDRCTTTSLPCTYANIVKEKGARQRCSPRIVAAKEEKVAPAAVVESAHHNNTEEDSTTSESSPGTVITSHRNLEGDLVASPEGLPAMASTDAYDLQHQPSSVVARSATPPFLGAIDSTEQAGDDFASFGGIGLSVFDLCFPNNCHTPVSGKFPASYFQRYLRLFFEHLFPIMPVLDRHLYLESALLDGQNLPTPEDYALLTALAAATIVQLNLPTVTSSTDSHHGFADADILIRHCLHERTCFDYTENPSTSTVITSFFLFAYFGNTEQHGKAWYYLQEAITFAEVLDMDKEDGNVGLSPGEVQWRRRIFWLLFITERAYAIQRRSRVRIRDCVVEMPAVFGSEEPRIIYGFINLIDLFQKVDCHFIATWRSQRQIACSKGWFSSLQSKLHTSSPMLMESNETQKIDVSVSRLWLRLLAWQIGVQQRLFFQDDCGQSNKIGYPIMLARDLAHIISTTSQQSLDSHGIGMEQKMSDIAHSLIDVLNCTSSPPFQLFYLGREYLHNILARLTNIRGQESRYLQQLILKAEPLINLTTTRDLAPAQSQDESEIDPSMTVNNMPSFI